MSKTTPIRAIGAKPSKEEMEAQARRAFIQKRNSLAEMIIANSVANCDGPEDYKALVDDAVETADYIMQKLFSVAVTEKPAEE